MAAYPSALPAPLVAEHQIVPLDQTIRTEMEVGSPRVRRRTTYRTWTVNLSWFYTDAEMAQFTDWWQNTVDGGAAWWTISLTIGNGGASMCEVRFMQPPTYKQNAGGTWVVSGAVECRLFGD